MPRRLGRQIGDRRDNFSRQSFFLLAMATKTVAAWSAVVIPEIGLLACGRSLEVLRGWEVSKTKVLKGKWNFHWSGEGHQTKKPNL